MLCCSCGFLYGCLCSISFSFFCMKSLVFSVNGSVLFHVVVDRHVYFSWSMVFPEKTVSCPVTLISPKLPNVGLGFMALLQNEAKGLRNVDMIVSYRPMF